MKVLFFDTETTGTPKDYRAPITNLENWPRIIQLAWEVADMSTERVLLSRKLLIEPDGWEIPQEDFWIKHGYTTEQNRLLGYAMGRALDLFIYHLNQSDIIVAHNFSFDYPITCAEMLRYGKAASKNPDRLKICTMNTTVNLCKIPFPRGGRGYKWPKLEELYKFLFKEGFEGAHDAGNDVGACRKAFFELIKRKVIKFKNNEAGKLQLAV